ncbi:MAG: hypothetical protein JNN01_08295 [Opitutaceae bacterium]|nr:hypothetical protein [Opitutaceae bacterium]
MEPRNLCELFLRGLGELEGASQAIERAERAIEALFAGHLTLSHFATNLIAVNRSRNPRLKRTLAAVGHPIAASNDRLCSAALEALCAIPPEPARSAVAATCAVEAIRALAACYEQRIGNLAETAILVGSEGVHAALAEWGFSWRILSANLRTESLRFRAMAYVADVAVPEVPSLAVFHHEPQLTLS